MLIGIFGENCSGKSTLAERIGDAVGAEIITGKDWLRMAKSESEARRLFEEKLNGAISGGDLIYVISEKEQLELLPDGALRILVCADLMTIKERFRARMHGVLPLPVEKMLEKKHGMFESEPCDIRFDGVNGDSGAVVRAVKELKSGTNKIS